MYEAHLRIDVLTRSTTGADDAVVAHIPSVVSTQPMDRVAENLIFLKMTHSLFRVMNFAHDVTCHSPSLLLVSESLPYHPYIR